MDTDQVYDVPDTPDRLAENNINERHFMRKESDSSVASHSGKTDFSDEGSRNCLRSRSKLVIDNGTSRRPYFRHVIKPCSSNKSKRECNFTISLDNTSSSKDVHLCRTMEVGNTSNRGNDVVDLTEQSGPMQLLQKTVPNRASVHCHTEEIRIKPCTSNKSKRGSNFTISLGNTSFKNVDLCSTVEVNNTSNGKNAKFSRCQPKEGKGKALWISTHSGNDVVDLTEQSSPMQLLQKTVPNRASGYCHTEEIRKRPIEAIKFSPMLKNACKGKEKVDDTCKGVSGADRGKGIFADSVPNAGKSLVSIPPSPVVRGPKRLVRNGFISPRITEKAKQLAENHGSGCSNVQSDKGALKSDFSSNLIRELIAEDTNSQRKPFSSKVPGTETMNFSTRHFLISNEEDIGTSNANGWLTTRNHTNQVNLTLSDQGQLLSQTKNDPHSVKQQNKNSVVRRDNGSRSRNKLSDIYHVGNENGHSAAASTSIKRQKQSSASSNRGETSTSTSTSTSHVSHHRGHNTRNSGSNDRERQLEADEMLARELQEQLYNETPGGGNGEIDAHIAMALQQEETSQPALSDGNHGFSHSRGPVIPNFNRQSRTRSSQHPPNRRGTQVRGRSSTRLARLRSRLPSQSTRVSNRERRSVFPSDMDLDMRMHILEALEAFNGTGVTGNIFQAEHDFNENDYESLLGLDENNHQHGGASLDQINMLPQSTVQGNNFDETCAICLDTPTTGDTIRHLLCLHKFHKDCIDPWLRRRTSCPVCKCSIT